MNLADIFLKILNMSFTGAVAIVVVFLVRLFFKKLPKKYTCILWIVVLIRLLCPLTIPTLVIGQPDIPEPIPSNIMMVQNPQIWSEIEIIDNSVNRVLEENFTADFGDSANPLQIVMPIGAVIWIVGMAGMLTYTAWNLSKFHKWVKEAIPDKELGNHIYRCETITPVVTGIINPKIYLPFHLKESQLLHVLIHENMHIQRKDHVLKLLFYIAVVVHWFNPFVWLAYRLLERDMEMACDEAVLAKIGADKRKSYCESLLELASSKKHFAGNPVAFGESDVKVRMKNLLNYKKPVFWVSSVVIVVIIIVAISCLSSPRGGEIYETSVTAGMSEVAYPLTKETVEPIFEQVDLPGAVTEEEYNSAIRTSIDIRDEENRLIMGIASNGEGEKRGLFITLVPYLHSGAASVVLPEEKWEDLIHFATLLYGFEDKSLVYHDFIESYKGYSIHTEYQKDEEPYYKDQYEWIKTYGNVTCVIEVCVATDETKDIQSISFYNTSEYSTINSEMAVRNFLYFVFNSIPGRYEAYEEATGGKYDPVNHDEAFLESDYSFAYTNHYKDRATDNCLQNMEHFGYFTLVDYLAAQTGSQVRLVNVSLTSAEDVSGDKDAKGYFYTAYLTNEKDGKTDEFTVQGSIGVANMLNGWKITDFLLSDTEALSMYITGDNVYYLGYELTDEQVQPQETEHHNEVTEEEMLEIFQTEYGWTDLANQELFWDETNGRVVINYYFEALADEWQMDSAREYGLTTFVFKRQNSLGGPHTYQLWANENEIKEVVIQVFCNGTMTYQDIYGGIEDRIVHTESHYEK